MTEAEIHTLSRLLMERTGLVGAGSIIAGPFCSNFLARFETVAWVSSS
jgi:hypothetical protein